MKKSLYVGSISMILISITSVSSTFAAKTNVKQVTQNPPEFSVLSESQLTTLKSLTWSAREEYLASLWITKPVHGSGSLEWSGGINKRHGPSTLEMREIPELTSLTDAEKAALESMTEDERDAFFASKWITRPTNTGSWEQTKQISKINTTVTSSTRLDSSNINRTERLSKQKAKILELKKARIQKKILANEQLTRLEKKFADENSIEY